MAELFYCKISKINYVAGTADLMIEDREGQIISGVPFLAGVYDMPGIGDMVAAIMDDTAGKIGRGVILGKIFSKNNIPQMSGAGVFYKSLAGGAYIAYNPSDKTLDIKVDKITAERITAKEITTDTV